MELAGEVEAVGAAVTEFEVGDEVFGIRGRRQRGVHLRAGEGVLAHKPAGMLRGGCGGLRRRALLALSCLQADVGAEGEHIVVYGASGSIGTAAVQLAKHFGAHVTAVCNTKNVELVRSLGADVVVDYQQEDFTKNGETYDVVFDAVGKHSFRRCRRSLKPGGTSSRRTSGSCGTSRSRLLATRWIGGQEGGNRDRQVQERRRLLLKELIEAGRIPRRDRPRGIRWSTSSRRRGTSRRSRRPETSS